MLCNNCGAENDKGAKFCQKCGSPLRDGMNQGEKTFYPEPAGGKNAASEFIDKMKALPKKVLLGAGAAIIVMIVIICAAVNSGKTINLNKYLTVETTGYNGYGTANAAIDWDAIEEKYGSKLSFTSEAKKEYGEFLGYITPIEVMKEYISVDLDERSRLSNGTTITCTWNVNEHLMDLMKCRIKYTNDSHTVSGLTKVGTFDAFADLKVEFSERSIPPV